MIINVLTDHKGELYSSKAMLKERKLTMNIDKLILYSREFDTELNFMNFHDISFRKNNYKDQVFLYNSSEDPNLLFKSYIEDIVLALKSNGAIVIPDYAFLRAHHNKVYMEILRDTILRDIDTGISSQHFGTYEDYKIYKESVTIPAVIKGATSSGSHYVGLIKSESDLRNLPKRYSRSPSLYIELKGFLQNFHPHSKYRKKFIIQNFIPGLTGDYKVLVFGDRYYVMGRKTRKNDFRASGSGNFIFDMEVSDKMLDFSESIYSRLKVPVVSMDIASVNNRYYLIEFQCLKFGTSAVERSIRYYKKEDGLWRKFDEPSVLEKEFIRSVVTFLKKSYEKNHSC